MPPPPPKSPDRDESGSPFEERPGHKAGDFIERDLWSLDDDEDGSEAGSASGKKTDEPEKPLPKAKRSTSPKKPSKPPADTATEEENPDQAPAEAVKLGRSKEVVTTLLPKAKLDDLDDPDDLDVTAPEADGTEDSPPAAPELDWEEKTSEPEPSSGEQEETPELESKPSSGEERETPGAEAVEGEKTDPETNSEFDDALTSSKPKETATPMKRPRLSRLELISLGIVLLAILIGGSWAMKTFFSQIPTRKSQILDPDFPVRGERVTVRQANTYWRQPIRSGENADTARMEARLIPVLELELSSTEGDGALRFFFRNGEGELIGDSVTRNFSAGSFTSTGGNRIEVAATDGFDDEGKHAAYQTSQTEPWVVEVHEGPQGTATSFEESFSLLFKMPISTDRR